MTEEAGYRKIFREAAEKASGAVKPLLQECVTLWDQEYAKLEAIVVKGGDHNKMLTRVHRTAAKSMPKWRTLWKKIDRLAKTDPDAAKARDDLTAAQKAYVMKMGI